MGTISRVGGRVSTAPGGKFRFDPSWLSKALSLRESEGTGGEGGSSAAARSKISLSETLWRTLCMNFSPQYHRPASDEFGSQFSMFMQLMIFAGADEKLLEAVVLVPSLDLALFTLIHLDHDPLQDLASTLDDLDTLQKHDGERCFTPSRSLMEEYYVHLKHTLVRNSPRRADGSPVEFNVPTSVFERKDRLVGRGLVVTNSQFFQRCNEFISMYFRAIGHRQLVIVDGKLLGVAGLLVETGDEVWVIPGIRAPVVLRRMRVDDASVDSADETSAPRYSFLGKAYVHGIMDGEANLGGTSFRISSWNRRLNKVIYSAGNH